MTEMVSVSYTMSGAELAALLVQLRSLVDRLVPGTDQTPLHGELLRAAVAVHVSTELAARVRMVRHIASLPSFTWEPSSVVRRSAYNTAAQYKWLLARRDGDTLAGPTNDEMYTELYVRRFTELKLDSCLSQTRAATCLVDYATCLAKEINGDALCHRIAKLRDLTHGPPAFRAALALELPSSCGSYRQLYRDAWEEMHRAEEAFGAEVLAKLKQRDLKAHDQLFLPCMLGVCIVLAFMLQQYFAWSWGYCTLAGGALTLPFDFCADRRRDAMIDHVRTRVTKVSEPSMRFLENEARTTAIHYSISSNEARSAYEGLLLAAEYRRDVDDTERCAICQEDFAFLERVTPLPGCLHAFHAKCLRGLQTPECPLCRHKILEVEEGSDGAAHGNPRDIIPGLGAPLTGVNTAAPAPTADAPAPSANAPGYWV